MKITERNILKQTNGGLTTYQALLPELIIKGNISNKIKSPFVAFRPDCLTLQLKFDRWYFEDIATGLHGDIFDFLAVKTGLDRIIDERHLMDIIAGIYNESEDKKIAMETVLFSKQDGLRLSFSDEVYHEKYIKIRFGSLLRNDVFNVAKTFEIQTLNSLSWVDDKRGLKNIVSGFQNDVPQIFFAFLNSLYTSDYAMIYEPFFRNSYDWGKRPDDFLLGYYESRNLIESRRANSDKLIITDNVETLLTLHARNQPAVALVDKVIEPSSYLLDVVVPHFASTELNFKRVDRYDPVKIYGDFKRKYGLNASKMVI